MNVNAKKAALVAGVCLSAIVAGTPQAFAVSVDTYQTAQQAKTVTGTVVDESGIPIIGANILEKGTTNGVIPTSTVTSALTCLKERSSRFHTSDM